MQHIEKSSPMTIRNSSLDHFKLLLFIDTSSHYSENDDQFYTWSIRQENNVTSPCNEVSVINFRQKMETIKSSMIGSGGPKKQEKI